MPRNSVASSLAYHVIRLYEPDHYASFVKADLAALLQSAGIEIADQQSALLSFAQITAGRRRA